MIKELVMDIAQGRTASRSIPGTISLSSLPHSIEKSHVKMKTIILINISFVLSVLGTEKVCETNEDGFKVCKTSNIITEIINTKGDEFGFLRLENNTVIGSNAFKSSNISELWIILPEYNSPNHLSLQPDSFTGLEDLPNLRILDANISYDGNPWGQLKNLRVLRCIRCGFTEVPTKILSSLPSLRELDLKGNAISRIRPDSFAGLKNLTTLVLDRNSPMTLDPGAFRGLEELRELHLADNSLELVPGVFDGLDKLDQLNLFGIFNSTITLPNTFRGMPALTRLVLSYGDLKSLNPGMFDGLLALRALKLDENQIHHIPKNVFNNLKSLDDLFLSVNNITTIEPGAFSGLNLGRLDLSSNRELGVIETGTFDGLVVGYLGLNFCNLSEIKPKAFSGLTAEALDLGVNQFTKIGTEDFSGLKVGILFLSFNNVTEVMPGAFKNTEVSRISLDGDIAENVNKTDWGLAESVDIG